MAMPAKCVMSVRSKVCEAFAEIGLRPLDGPCECRICFGSTEGGVVVARFTDQGEHLEFEVARMDAGVGGNLVSAVLMWDAGDFWVSSDVRPELNGRERVFAGDGPLLEQALAYIRNLDRSVASIVH